MKFELLVAIRYLRAKRAKTVISMITFIAILGVGAGVAALVVAMAVSEGQREDIRDRLLGAQAHLTITGGPEGIANYDELTKEIGKVDGVVGAAPHSEQGMVISSTKFAPVLVKGIFPELEEQVSQLRSTIKRGQLDDLKGNSIVIGKELSDKLGDEPEKIVAPIKDRSDFEHLEAKGQARLAKIGKRRRRKTNG